MTTTARRRTGLVATLVAAIAAIAAIPTPAHARPPAPLPAEAVAVLHARFPGLQVLAQASGALHAPEARDLAVVLGRGERGARLVAVLWSDGARGWRLANASGDVDAACPACEVGVRIRDATLEVSTSDPAPAVATLRSWRFAYGNANANANVRAAALRLVGVRSERVAPGGASEVVTADLLTGERATVVAPAPPATTPRRERRTRVPVRQAIAFDQFAFEFRGDAPETRFAGDLP